MTAFALYGPAKIAGQSKSGGYWGSYVVLRTRPGGQGLGHFTLRTC